MRLSILDLHKLGPALCAGLGSWLLALGCSCSTEAPAEPSGGSAVGTNQSTTAAAASPQVTAEAKLRFRTLTHDFGDVDDTDELHYGFEFTNEGTGVLEISEVKPSCGCTTTALEKMIYEPGEEGEIELVFHPKGYGPQTKTLTVKSNSKGSERIIVYIKSKVTPFVQFEPRAVRFNQVPSTEAREAEVTVTCRDSQAVFGSPQCTNPNFEVQWTSPPLDGTGKLLVKLRSGAPKGNVINKVKLDVQGTPKAGGASIRHHAELVASAAVYGSIIIDPVFISVGRVDPGGRVDKSVDLKLPKDQPFKILAAELKNASPPNLEISVTPKGTGWTVRVQGNSGTYQGLVRGIAVITTDVQADPTLKIPVMGAVRPDPKK